MLHTTNKACPMMSGGNTDSRQNTCMKPDTLPLHSSFEHVSKALFGPKFFFCNFSKLTPKFSAFFVVFVGKEITINIVQN